MFEKNSLENKANFHAAISIDCVIFGIDHKCLKVLLIKSDFENYLGKFSLLGGLVSKNEDIDIAAYRVLSERTGIDNLYLEQVASFGKYNRHPSGRVLSIAYYSLVNINQVMFIKEDNELHWHDVSKIQKLAFDHNEILFTCIKRLQEKIKVEPVGFNLLPKKFSLRELQNVYEAVLLKELDRRNFRKKFLSSGILTDLKESEQEVRHRPAKLYSFNKENFSEWSKNGNTIF